MKRILLASTAIVAFAGAAAADGHTGVSFGGDAELGYNDDFDNGIFWSFGLTVSGAMELDNGLTATISGDVELINAPETNDNGTPNDTTDDFVENDGGNSAFDGNEVEIDDLVIGIASETASLKFGDTAPAADTMYSSAVTNVDADSFNDEDDLENEDAVLIGRMSFGATEVGLSYAVETSNQAPDDDLEALQVAVTTTIGSVDLGFGYQEGVEGLGSSVGTVDIADTPEVIAFSASTTLGGVDLGFAYAKASSDVADAELTSIGVQAAYTFSDITATVFYVSQDLDGADTVGVDYDDNYGIALDYASGPITVGFYYHDGADEETAINVGYDVGNGLNLFAGYLDEMDTLAGDAGSSYFYVGGDYDLGGGANLRVSYADVDEGDVNGLTLDELGAAEDVKEGATIAMSFTF